MKKVLITILSVVFVFTSLAVNVNAAMPCISVSPLSTKNVREYGQILFTIKYSNDIKNISLDISDIKPIGFNADIRVISVGNSRVICASNIKDTDKKQSKKKFKIKKGTATSSDKQKSISVNTEEFSIR